MAQTKPLAWFLRHLFVQMEKNTSSKEQTPPTAPITNQNREKGKLKLKQSNMAKSTTEIKLMI